MITLNASSIFQIVLVIVIYIVFCKYQRILLRGSYFSVQDIIFSRNLYKAIVASISRLLFVFFVSLFLLRVLKVPHENVIIGFAVGSFLLTWPSMYLYRLAFHRNNPVKRYYFWGCITSMLFTISSAYLCAGLLIPALYGERDISIYSNTGIQLIISLFTVVLPLPANILLRSRTNEHDFHGEPSTFKGDLYILANRLNIEHKVIDDYRKYILESSKKHDIPYKLLFTVLSVEYVNRDTWIVRCFERLMCVHFPKMASKLDLSVGLAQLKISTVKNMTHEPYEEFVPKLIDNKYNIDMCARYLALLIDAYNNQTELDESTDVFETVHGHISVLEYIATKYLTGSANSKQRFTKVYTAILEAEVPELASENG